MATKIVPNLFRAVYHLKVSSELGIRDSFRAHIIFLSPEEGGRKSPCIQGYRPDFMYEGDSDQAWMIWPRFLDKNGSVLPDGSVVPKEIEALMYILNDDLRKSVHQQRVKPGLPFLICEGPRVVATGVVLVITGLFDS